MINGLKLGSQKTSVGQRHWCLYVQVLDIVLKNVFEASECLCEMSLLGGNRVQQ